MDFLRRNLANIMTLINLFLGFTGIITVLYGEIIVGSYLIIFACLFDLLDGFLARLLKISSNFGKQLDSFADLVSFGVLPAIILHSMILRTHYEWANSLYFAGLPVVSLLPFIITIGATIRLARFNLTESSTSSFEGVPTPAVALFVSSIPLIIKNDLYVFSNDTIYLQKFIMNPFLLLGISLFFFIMMISRKPMLTMKFTNFTWKENSPRYIVILLFIILFILFYYIAIPVTIILYIVFSFVFSKKFRRDESVL